MPKPRKRTTFWTYEEARRTVPYVRRLLATLRETYIACGHLSLQSRRNPDADGILEEWWRHRDGGVAVLEELDRLGIGVFQSPLRGIALYRLNVEVEVDDETTADMIGYFVYKDSRDQIETFVFCPDLYDCDGLFGAERPIPDALKQAASYLTREQVPPVPAPEPCWPGWCSEHEVQKAGDGEEPS